MSGGPAPAQLDLEKELSCSICTDIFYQPLTLLDCLHTFCGACLKEWFLSQASRATSLHPYTCPACRASVRATKHNASIATLLDMYLQMNPTKGRTEEEKKDSLKIYKAGDNVLPKLRRRGRRTDDDEDQRVLNDVMALSIQGVGIQDTSSHSTSRRRREHGSRDRRTSEGASAAQPEPRQVGLYLHGRGDALPRARQSVRPEPIANPTRSLDHQSSLRSLLSVSESDVEDEILRQIMEDGLLNGVDLSNMTSAQEDALSERIATAYRTRRDEQRRQRRAAERANEATTGASHRSRERSRHQSRPRSSSRRPDHQASAIPPSANPSSTLTPTSNLQVANTNHANPSSRHRSASADNSTSLNVPRPIASPASRSASDLPLPLTNDMQGSSLRSSHRRSTEPDGQLHREIRHNLPERSQASRLETENSSIPIVQEPEPAISPSLHASTFPIDNSRSRSSQSTASVEPGIEVARANQPTVSSIQTNHSNKSHTHQESTSNISIPSIPSISCRSCLTNGIEYDLHFTCFKCDEAGHSLCKKCYRQGQGCQHWFGFGRAAWQKFYQVTQAQGASHQATPPHILVARRYVQAGSGRLNMSNEHRTAVQTGVFCDICDNFANDWYWRCDVCNEGEWGYCSSCVNQGRHCTHPLLPLVYQATDRSSPRELQEQESPQPFAPKALTTACDICTYPIPPSNSRYHCLECNAGDYDMHLNCYTSLVKSGQISEHNGHNGWRRCLKGHRMVVLGFEDRDGGQKRVVVRDLVGGYALREDNIGAAEARQAGNGREAIPPSTPPATEHYNAGWRWTDADGTSRFQSPTSNSPSPISNSSMLPPLQFPPDGGVGLRLHARWGYFPSEPDELMFPKGAEIREAEDINGDWHWGVYAGSKGLFPGNYGRVISRR